MIRKYHRIIIPWLTIFFLFLFIALPRAETSACLSQPLFFGVALDGYPISTEHLQKVTTDIGTSPEMVIFFLQWPTIKNQKAARFPGKSLNAIWNAGAMACLTWEPMFYNETGEVMVPYQALLNGAYDPYLLAFAKQAAVISNHKQQLS